MIKKFDRKLIIFVKMCFQNSFEHELASSVVKIFMYYLFLCIYLILVKKSRIFTNALCGGGNKRKNLVL